METKETALSIAQRHYGMNSYIMDSWVEDEWHIMHPPEVWQANVVRINDKWFIEIPDIEEGIVIDSFFREVPA